MRPSDRDDDGLPGGEFDFAHVGTGDLHHDQFLRHLMRDLSRRVHTRLGQPVPTCLAVGARTPHPGEMLSRHGFDVTRHEIAVDSMPTDAGDPLALPYASGTFDTVATFGLIQYLDDWWRLVAEAMRVVKPGGYTLIETAYAFPMWENVIRSVQAWGRREQAWRTVWQLARAHALGADLRVAPGQRRFSRRDMLACMVPHPVLQVVVHAPRRRHVWHEAYWAVTLMKHEHANQEGVPPLVVDCEHCRKPRAMRASREPR